jgi:hypothetical protein
MSAPSDVLARCELLAPHGGEAALAALLSAPPPCARPFYEALVAFVAELGRALTLDPAARRYQELVALGFWFRKARLDALREGVKGGDRYVVRARGTVFHIAPANVDSVFVYSWLLSLLCGNRNVVRVSSKRGPQLEVFFGILNRLLSQDGWRDIAERNVITSYPHDDAITKALSACCDLRVIWGGDDTVARIRQVLIPPRATELTFANRQSAAVMCAGWVCGIDNRRLDLLAEQFCADTFWFGQQACSSPRVVYWVGTPDEVVSARAAFWPRVDAAFARKGLSWLPAEKTGRFAIACAMVGEHDMARVESELSGPVLRVAADSYDGQFRGRHGGYGLMVEVARGDLASLVTELRDEDQTLACGGFDPDSLRALAEALPGGAIDRIVPIGSALEFDAVWDGHDLLSHFTRRVLIA